MLIRSFGVSAMAAKKERVPVTERALIQRINRKLRSRNGYALKAARGDRWRSELGDYYTVDVDRNWIVEKHVDPEELGRKLGALAQWEKLEGP
jgi:hypothetical protein